MKRDELRLTKGEIDDVISMSNQLGDILQVPVDTLAPLLKAQLAKAKPIIEKQERERIVALIDDCRYVGTGAIDYCLIERLIVNLKEA